MRTQSLKKDANDWDKLRWARNKHVGVCVQNEYNQQIPFFFNREGMNLHLIGLYKGYGCFLCCGGPSLKEAQARRFTDAGVLSMSVNNAVSVVRTDMWCCVDEPTHFIASMWLDPKIMKFVPMAHFGSPLWDTRNGEFQPLVHNGSQCVVGDCPNIIGYRRNEKFNADRYLWEDTINWGDTEKFGGNRSVMLAAIRILFLLGIRRIYLLGVDFEMTEESKYAFQENRSGGSIKGNNATYRKLMERFGLLKKHFVEVGLEVFNCNVKSKLDVFPHMSFMDALTKEKAIVGNPAKETTEGLYQTDFNEKQVEYVKRVTGIIPEIKVEEIKVVEPLADVKAQTEAGLKKLEEIVARNTG